MFRSNIKLINDHFKSSNLKPTDMIKVQKLLLEISNENLNHLRSNSNETLNKVRKCIDKLSEDIVRLKNVLTEREVSYINRSKKELNDCVEILHSYKIHNTPKSLKIYCLLFIYIYPFIFVLGEFPNSVGGVRGGKMTASIDEYDPTPLLPQSEFNFSNACLILFLCRLCHCVWCGSRVWCFFFLFVFD